MAQKLTSKQRLKLIRERHLLWKERQLEQIGAEIEQESADEVAPQKKDGVPEVHEGELV